MRNTQSSVSAKFKDLEKKIDEANQKTSHDINKRISEVVRVHNSELEELHITLGEFQKKNKKQIKEHEIAKKATTKSIEHLSEFVKTEIFKSQKAVEMQFATVLASNTVEVDAALFDELNSEDGSAAEGECQSPFPKVSSKPSLRG